MSRVNPYAEKTVENQKTELLFVVPILRIKKPRYAGINNFDGVLFGSPSASKDLCKALIENNQLEAIDSLPSGVFKPA